MKEFYNLFLFIAICFFIFILFRSFHYNPMIIEGMTDASGNTVTVNACETAVHPFRTLPDVRSAAGPQRAQVELPLGR